STTKFWPSHLVGETPRACASRRTSAGPSRPWGVVEVTRSGCHGWGSVEEVTAAAPLPGASPLVQQLGAVELLCRGRVDRVPAATHRAPGGEAELVEPVVAGGVDGTGVPARLA